MTKNECKMLSDIVLDLHIFFDSDQKKVAAWLHMKNYNFGNISPIQLIMRGRIKKVHQFIKASMDGV